MLIEALDEKQRLDAYVKAEYEKAQEKLGLATKAAEEEAAKKKEAAAAKKKAGPGSKDKSSGSAAGSPTTDAAKGGDATAGADAAGAAKDESSAVPGGEQDGKSTGAPSEKDGEQAAASESGKNATDSASADPSAAVAPPGSADASVKDGEGASKANSEVEGVLPPSTPNKQASEGEGGEQEADGDAARVDPSSDVNPQEQDQPLEQETPQPQSATPKNMPPQTPPNMLAPGSSSSSRRYDILTGTPQPMQMLSPPPGLSAEWLAALRASEEEDKQLQEGMQKLQHDRFAQQLQEAEAQAAADAEKAEGEEEEEDDEVEQRIIDPVTEAQQMLKSAQAYDGRLGDPELTGDRLVEIFASEVKKSWKDLNKLAGIEPIIRARKVNPRGFNYRYYYPIGEDPKVEKFMHMQGSENSRLRLQQKYATHVVKKGYELPKEGLRLNLGMKYFQKASGGGENGGSGAGTTSDEEIIHGRSHLKHAAGYDEMMAAMRASVAKAEEELYDRTADASVEKIRDIERLNELDEEAKAKRASLTEQESVGLKKTQKKGKRLSTTSMASSERLPDVEEMQLSRGASGVASEH
ncbi:unnamed protein product [Amoebophrya sp. A25]|nr:unnamed protein product [Amoebophrya sp. A25]|eukprot:GSA25T00007041001.1